MTAVCLPGRRHMEPGTVHSGWQPGLKYEDQMDLGISWGGLERIFLHLYGTSGLLHCCYSWGYRGVRNGVLYHGGKRWGLTHHTANFKCSVVSFFSCADYLSDYLFLKKSRILSHYLCTYYVYTVVNSYNAYNHIGPVSGLFDINLDITLYDMCSTEAHIVPLLGKQTHSWHLRHIS